MASNLDAYDPVFEEAGKEWNVDPLLLKAIAEQESGGNPKAVSKAGAQGLMQIIPATQRQLGVGKPFDPVESIWGGAKYLSQALDAEGTPERALAYYHGGPDWAAPGMYGPESAAYVPAVTQRYLALQQARAPGSNTSSSNTSSSNTSGGATKPGPAGESVDDFLKRTGGGPAGKVETAAPESVEDFLKRTGGAPEGGAAEAPAQEAAPFKPETAETRRIGDLMTPGPPTATPAPAPAPPKINVPGVSGPPNPLDFGQVGQAAREGYDSGAAVTPAGVEWADQHGLGFIPRGINMLSGAIGAAGGGAMNILGQAADAVLPGLGRDVVQGAQLAAPFVMSRAAPGGNLLAEGVARTTGEAAKLDRVAPLSPEFKASPMAPGVAEKIAPPVGPQAAGAEVTSEPIPPPTPAQKATALQKMVNQSAEDRLTPQGRDDNVYVPGVVRPEAMRDFTPAADGQMSTALQHKTLYNTDSNYHDQFDAQVKKNNTIMVDNLHDMFGDANTREAAMEHARELMPGSVDLFKNEKPVDVQPVVDTINKILAGPKGKIDGVLSNMRNILPKLRDADGNPETMPSMIKGIYDDVNNKLYDKSPTKEGNEARQAREQLLEVKAALSKVIGSGLPGSKWTDYLTNLSGALGQVSKLDYLQQYLTGAKKLTNLSGDLQLNKVQKMLEDINARHADKTGGAKELSMDEINRIEAVRNELAAKDLLDKRAAVRGSPTAQLTNASGILGSGPLGAAVKGAAEVALHTGLAATTGGVGNAALGGYRYIIKPAMQAAKAQKEANALAATKNRLLDTEPNPLAGP